LSVKSVLSGTWIDIPEATQHSIAPRHASAPPTCAVCGVTDYTVAMTDQDRRTLHVACWNAETALNRRHACAAALADPDGVARSEAAIEAMWDAAEALAHFRRVVGKGAL